MKAIKIVIPTDGLRIGIEPVDAEPYIDCLNKDESLLSLFKRCIVQKPDGTYVLQIHYV